MDILSLTAVGLAAAIKAGEVSAVDAMKAVLDRIDQTEKEINAYDN